MEDANGCLSDAEASVDEPIELVVNLGPDTTIHLGDQVEITAQLNFTELESFAWSPANFLDRTDSLVVLSTPLNSMRYSILVRDSLGCSAIDDILVIVERDKRVYIPNVFLPDSEGQNNLLTIFAGDEVSKVNKMQIYDRWGELLFENLNFLPNDPEFGWNGQAKGQNVTPGVYVYVIEVTYVDGETEVFAGDVTVVR